MSAASTLEQMKSQLGKEIFVSDWKEITQVQINQFAECTGDHQWIHVDVEKAAQGPFGKTISHGFLTLSLLPYFSYQRTSGYEGAKMGINYGLNKVRFLTPVPVGSKLRDRMVLTDVEEKPDNRLLVTITHTLEIQGYDKPACIAEGLSMVFF